MNPRQQNILSIITLALALVIGTSEWLNIGATIEHAPPASAKAPRTVGQAG